MWRLLHSAGDLYAFRRLESFRSQRVMLIEDFFAKKLTSSIPIKSLMCEDIWSIILRMYLLRSPRVFSSTEPPFLPPHQWFPNPLSCGNQARKVGIGVHFIVAPNIHFVVAPNVPVPCRLTFSAESQIAQSHKLPLSGSPISFGSCHAWFDLGPVNDFLH